METLIIGGGIASLSLAYHLLLKNSQSVTIVESGKVGQGSSSKAAGMVTPASEAHLGEDALLKTFVQSCEYYESFIGQLTGNNPEKVDYQKSGSLMCAVDQDGKRELLRLNDFQTSMGLKVREVSAKELKEKEPYLSPKVILAMLAEDEACVDTLKLIGVLKEKVLDLGGKVLENQTVKKISVKNDCIQSVVLQDGSELKADKFVLATGLGPQPQGLEDSHKIPLRPVKGQVLSIQCAPGTLKHPVRIYQRYPIYLVPRSSGEVIIGATSEEFSDENVTAGGLMDLIYGAWQVLPLVYEQPVLRTWSGLRPATPDHKPILGKSKLANLFFFLGLYRHGIMLSPFLGKEMAALLNEEETNLDWETFSIQRFP